MADALQLGHFGAIIQRLAFSRLLVSFHKIRTGTIAGERSPGK
jgi:hypothetical protein